jgi:hypothetical protein
MSTLEPLLNDEQLQRGGSTRRMNFVTMQERVEIRPLSSTEVRAFYEAARLKDREAARSIHLKTLKVLEGLDHGAGCAMYDDLVQSTGMACTCGRDEHIALLRKEAGVTS